MKHSSFLVSLGLAALPLVAGDWQFKSRPDLSPPRLNITIPAHSAVDAGYLFVTPYASFEGHQGGPQQAAAYIFRDDGDLVWSSLGYFAGWVGNFQVVNWKGKPALQAFQGSLDSFHGHGYGYPILLDEHYDQIALVRGGNHRLISLHEFQIVNEETALVEIYQPKAMDLSRFGGTKQQQWIAEGIFQEINIETGELIYEGHTLDFADPADSAVPLSTAKGFSGVNSTDAWDYFHINSVDKDDEGNYLVSGRHMSTIYKVNGTTGKLIWQLGGPKSTFDMSFKFAYQHDARFRSRSSDGQIEVISFFDNSARSSAQRGGGLDKINSHSKGRVVMLNHTDNTATEVKTLAPPDDLLVPSQGNLQFLPNGNMFVNWGQMGAVTEYRANDSSPIFHAYLGSGSFALGTQSYRGFRYPWVGRPTEKPALLAERIPEGLTVYVSWNGDTETTMWLFYTDSDNGKRYLGKAKKVSFETSYTIDGSSIEKDEMIFAEAIDKEGSVLGRSYTVRIQAVVNPASEIVHEEVLTHQVSTGNGFRWMSSKYNQDLK